MAIFSCVVMGMKFNLCPGIQMVIGQSCISYLIFLFYLIFFKFSTKNAGGAVPVQV